MVDWDSAARSEQAGQQRRHYIDYVNGEDFHGVGIDHNPLRRRQRDMTVVNENCGPDKEQ